MTYKIYPFEGILPVKKTKYKLVNNLLLENKIHYHSTFKELYVEHLIKNNKFKRDKKPNFYIYRKTFKSFTSTGLIAKISNAFSDINIIPHEKTINQKINKYIRSFTIHNIQINPIILVHEESVHINSYLETHMNLKKPSIKIEDKDTLVEIWKVTKSNEIQQLYSPIKTLFIADGHHRLKAFSKLPTIPYFTVLLLPHQQLYSATILRKYIKLTDLQKKECFHFFNSNFIMKKIHKTKNLALSHKFYILFEYGLYMLQEKVTEKLTRKILVFLDKHINYTNNNHINFVNQPLYSTEDFNCNILKIDFPFSIVIPPAEIKKKINSCYPPHSSWLEPKMPDGLLTFILGEAHILK